MGASTSSRRLTVENPDPHIIQVTEDVVNRLRAAGPPTVTKPANVSLPPETTSNGNENTLPPPDVVRQGDSYGILNANRDGRPIIETITAHQVRLQKEEELRSNDLLWAKKVKDLESRYATSAFASQEEFNSKLSKLEALVPKTRTAPCETLTTKVMQCYSENPKRLLRCSDEVKNFAQCVDNVRTA